jgi:hypothetical protein
VSPRTRAILAVSPNNPTGSFLTRGEIEALGRIAAERGIALVGDEVFADYPIDERCEAPSVLADPVALTFGLGGLSKSAGLPQLKLGWIGIGGPDALVTAARARLELICDTYLSVSTPVQQALIAAGRDIRSNPGPRAVNHRFECGVARPACTLLPASGVVRGDPGPRHAERNARPVASKRTTCSFTRVFLRFSARSVRDRQPAAQAEFHEGVRRVLIAPPAPDPRRPVIDMARAAGCSSRLLDSVDHSWDQRDRRPRRLALAREAGRARPGAAERWPRRPVALPAMSATAIDRFTSAWQARGLPRSGSERAAGGPPRHGSVRRVEHRPCATKMTAQAIGRFQTPTSRAPRRGPRDSGSASPKVVARRLRAFRAATAGERVDRPGEPRARARSAHDARRSLAGGSSSGSICTPETSGRPRRAMSGVALFGDLPFMVDADSADV